ncbi:MAG: ribosome modulation factor [Pirellulaceae bacterium]
MQASQPYRAAIIDRFVRGADAAKRGKAAQSCPYQAGANRKSWLRGYVLGKVEQAAPAELLRCAAVAWKSR